MTTRIECTRTGAHSRCYELYCAVHDRVMLPPKREQRPQSERDDARIHRCTGCGDFLWASRSCPTCAIIAAQAS